jgi:hypothetical protein
VSRSKYIKTSHYKLPKHRRSVKLEGSFEDSNKWIKCWNCGFVNDMSKLSLSNESGISVQKIITITNEGKKGDTGEYNTPRTDSTLERINARDMALPIAGYLPQATRGCRMCGCTNLP